MAATNPTPVQQRSDRENAAFWNELCGSKFALEIGVEDTTPESIARFDEAYFSYYPYLLGYVPGRIEGERILEIGLGFGSLSEQIVESGGDYQGLDIAEGPVEMVRERLRRQEISDAAQRVQQGSALQIPHPDATFDCVLSIGCLHHTGDLPRAIAEVHRVLRPRAQAVVMLYNRYSFRRAVLSVLKTPALFRRNTSVEREVRRVYDQTLDGEPAPIVDYTSVREARRLFSDFATVDIRRENFDAIKFLPRRHLLGLPARLAGVDLYITAAK